ncbi:glyoxalase superfamily protein [Reyranella sp.]|uniref:glyoxalase superfamily protein n=1 Tax=Reyranella sp. TaxID=1929291 RepID=UPI003D0CC432
MSIELQSVVPILRIFSVEKAQEFYVDFLGFTWDWEHRFDDNAPVYAQISRTGLVLHLSEHHGGGSPGAHITINMTGIEELHRELSEKKYRYGRPGLEEQPWGAHTVSVSDPFGNRLTFTEPNSQ